MGRIINDRTDFHRRDFIDAAMIADFKSVKFKVVPMPASQGQPMLDKVPNAAAEHQMFPGYRSFNMDYNCLFAKIPTASDIFISEVNQFHNTSNAEPDQS